MDFFENIDALLWRLAAILALVLVATLVVRLLLRDRGRSDRQQKLRVQQTLKGSGLAADKAPNGFTFGLLGGKKVYLPCDGEGHIAIFGGNDPTALGAYAAAEAAGSDALIYGVDGSPDVKALVAEGGITGTGAQSPINIGKTIAEVYYQWLDGEEVEARYPIETFMINADNVAEYGTDGWQ